PLKDLELVENELRQTAKDLQMKGLIILGPEGLNATIATSSEEALSKVKSWVVDRFQCPEIMFKDSKSQLAPFRRFSVKIRPEIVTLGTPDLQPSNTNNHHLSPEDWNKVLKEEQDFLLIDTRNWYEYQIGTFKGAVNPEIDQFTEFPDWVDQQNYAKDKKMLIFCTGGIRCEKGILELQRRGYDKVYQLEGGILNYLEKLPNDQYEGECFVFDQRVAVDQNMEPSKKYKLCPHCGQPGTLEITCSRCDSPTVICNACDRKPYVAKSCSKNCAYHLERFPGKKGAKQVTQFLV
ncbi:MAG: hypothetical protein COT73_00750, partial [Bdellovibrio sp. CG10_big_fil_rev_8_21_14_0_10_47_8]